jgi:hypothetical protein
MIAEARQLQAPPAERWGSPEFHKRQSAASALQDRQQQEVEDPQANYEAWNNWCDQKIADFLNQYTDTLIPMVFNRIEKARQIAERQLTELKTEVAELRGEVNLLRELLKGSSNVKDISHKMRKDIA